MQNRKHEGMKTMSKISGNVKKGSRTSLILWVIMIGMVGATAYGWLSSTTQIDLTPEEFQPVRVQSAFFDVRKLDGTLLGTIDGKSNLKYFTPQSSSLLNHPADDYLYPKVDIMYSQPFMSDAGGTPVTDVSAYHRPAQRLVTGGNAYFLNTYYMSMDIGARTYSNLPVQKDTTTYLSPWRNYQFDYTDPSAIGIIGSRTYSSTNNPGIIGSLVLYTDVGTNPWQYTYAPTLATISTSLEPIDFQLSTWNNAPLSGYTYADAIAKLQQNYGNQKVVVQPHIVIDGLSNYIRYSYEEEQTLPDGSKATITVNTKSALVGFADAYKAPFDLSDKVGLIPNYFSSQYKVAGLAKDDKPVEESAKPATTETSGDKSLTSSSRTITGSVVVKQTSVDPEKTITGGAAVHGITTNLNEIDNLYIDLNDLEAFSLPEDLTINTEFEMQPKTSIKIAHAEVKYTAWWWDGAFPYYEDTTVGPAYADIFWPYAISIENVYAVTRCTWKLQILTENEIQGVYANGQPIDVSKITDFELSEIVNDPTQDNMETSLTKDLGMSAESILTLVLVIVFVVLGLITTIYISKAVAARRSGTVSQPRSGGAFKPWWMKLLGR